MMEKRIIRIGHKTIIGVVCPMCVQKTIIIASRGIRAWGGRREYIRSRWAARKFSEKGSRRDE